MILTMQWSKLKQLVEGKFADAIKGRVEIFSTTYRKPNSNNGRGWITIDKEELVNFATIKSWLNFRAYYHETTQTYCITHSSVKDSERTTGQLIEEGEFSRFDLHNCCWEYLNLTVEEAIKHASPLINSLAILDKRFGKRRLLAIDKDALHPLTKSLFEFRLSVENLKQVNKNQ